MFVKETFCVPPARKKNFNSEDIAKAAWLTQRTRADKQDETSNRVKSCLGTATPYSLGANIYNAASSSSHIVAAVSHDRTGTQTHERTTT